MGCKVRKIKDFKFTSFFSSLTSTEPCIIETKKKWENKKTHMVDRVHGIAAIDDENGLYRISPIAMPDSEFPSINFLFPMDGRHIPVDPSGAFLLAICAFSANLLQALARAVLPALRICLGMSRWPVWHIYNWRPH